MSQTVVFGFIGANLDNGRGAGRWSKWRPTVAICQQEEFVVDRLELLHDPRHQALAQLLCDDIRQVSPETMVNLHAAVIRDPWDFEEVYGVLLDLARMYTFDLEQEDYLMHITTGTHVAQICMFLLTEARYFPARLLQTSPPKRQRDDAPGQYTIIDLDLTKYNQLASRFHREQQQHVTVLKSGIATRDPAFNKMITQIERIATRSRAPLLLMGPTGAGKSFLARQIYALKKSRHLCQGEFVEINCATLRGDGAMSALFGHVKGSYTGAVAARAGLLRSADRGLVFLDEIGELGLDEQAMLLKAIEDKRFFPVGADKEVLSDFQLIAGTNRDLRNAVNTGQFREDLFARINHWTFFLPSLAERAVDIEPNIDYELARFSQQQATQVRFNKEAKAKYLNFAVSPEATWPGNFRELSASINRMAVLAEGGRITEEIVAEELERLRMMWGAEVKDELENLLSSEQLANIDLFDRLQLRQVITVCHRSKTMAEAGRALFAATRAAKQTNNDSDRLRKYLARFGLEWGKLKVDIE